MTTGSLDRADVLVGRFFRLFGAIELELNEAIRKLFELSNDSAETICANLEFFKKVNIVRSALSDQDKEGKRKEIDKLFGCITSTASLSPTIWASEMPPSARSWDVDLA